MLRSWRRIVNIPEPVFCEGITGNYKPVTNKGGPSTRAFSFCLHQRIIHEASGGKRELVSRG